MQNEKEKKMTESEAKEETESKKETKNTEDEETSFCLSILASIVGGLLGYVLARNL